MERIIMFYKRTKNLGNWTKRSRVEIWDLPKKNYTPKLLKLQLSLLKKNIINVFTTFILLAFLLECNWVC